MRGRQKPQGAIIIESCMIHTYGRGFLHWRALLVLQWLLCSTTQVLLATMSTPARTGTLAVEILLLILHMLLSRNSGCIQNVFCWCCTLHDESSQVQSNLLVNISIYKRWDKQKARPPHQCWDVSTGDKSEPPVPASGDLQARGGGRKNNK